MWDGTPQHRPHRQTPQPTPMGDRSPANGETRGRFLAASTVVATAHVAIELMMVYADGEWYTGVPPLGKMQNHQNETGKSKMPPNPKCF